MIAPTAMLARSTRAGGTTSAPLRIVVMMENHRSGLLWKLFMSVPEVQAGLRALDFSSPHLAAPVAARTT